MENSFFQGMIHRLPAACACQKIIYDERNLPCDYELIDVNLAYEKMLSLKAADLIGRRISHVMPCMLESRLNKIRCSEEEQENNLPLEFEAYFEGLEKWYHVIAYHPERNYLVTLFFDVTHMMKRTEDQSAVYAMMDDAILELDDAYCFTNVIAMDENMLFLPKEKIIGRKAQHIIPPELIDAFFSILKKAKGSGKRESTIYPMIMNDQGKWYQANVKYLESSSRKRFVISISDITEQRQLEQKLQERETLFRTVFEQAPIGIAVMKNDNFYSNINPMFEKIVGRSKEELKHLRSVDITHPDDYEESQEGFQRLQARKTDAYAINKRFLKPDGSDVWVNLTVAPLRFPHKHKKDEDYLCLIQDITERLQAEKTLKESERSKAVLLAHLPGMAYRCNFDRDWTMQFVSRGCLDLTGYPPESLLYNRDLSFNDMIVPEYRKTLWQEWERVISQKAPFRYEYEITTASGERKWVLEMGQGVYSSQNAVEAIEGIIIDITGQRKREAEIQYINDHDFLTGLYNRKYFDELSLKIDQEGLLPVSILIADINGVRLINDTLGLSEGDKMIKATSKILQSLCRPGDVLARIGGDEFGMILPNTDSESAYQLRNSIYRVFAAYNDSQKTKSYEINLSIGYASKEKPEDNIAGVKKIADEFLRNSKLLNHKSFHSNIITTMMATVYEKSHETEVHAKRLADLTLTIGKKLNISEKSLGELELLAMLHDIGKVGIDDRILNKPGKLDENEWAVMKKHPEIGYRIVKSSSELEPIAECILAHHERWDGKGYPKGLKGEEIPLLSRILAVVDAYDAMTEDRVYRKALGKKAAVSEIKKNAGTQFDPEIARLFIESLSASRA